MECFWLRFADLAAREGLDAFIAYPRPGPLPPLTCASGIQTVVVPVPGRGLGGLWGSLRLVRECRAEVMYFTDRPFFHGSYALYRLLGVRQIVVHDHIPGDYSASFGLVGWAKSILNRLPWFSADSQWCVSPLMAQRAVQAARVPAARIRIVQNGIGEAPPLPRKLDLHREFDLPENAQVCVTVARASKNKRIDFLIEVAQRCRGSGLDSVYFLHCGDGPELERLQEKARDSGVSERIRFAGRRADVAAILSSANFALHPSQGEAFSLAVLEYMRAELVLLVPDIPSVSQAVRHGDTGIVYPDANADAVARLLGELLASPERCRRLGKAARASVTEHYSATQMMAQFDSAVRSVLTKLT